MNVTWSLTISLSLIAVTIVFLATSLATNHWLEKFYSGTEHVGLFISCVREKCTSTPADKIIPGNTRPTKGLLITAIIMNVMCAIVIPIFKQKRNNTSIRRYGLLCALICSLAACCAAAGVAYYMVLNINSDYSNNSQYGYSLYLAWMAVFLSILSGAVSRRILNNSQAVQTPDIPMVQVGAVSAQQPQVLNPHNYPHPPNAINPQNYPYPPNAMNPQNYPYPQNAMNQQNYPYPQYATNPQNYPYPQNAMNPQNYPYQPQAFNHPNAKYPHNDKPDNTAF